LRKKVVRMSLTFAVMVHSLHNRPRQDHGEAETLSLLGI
jgi:hypothetical protein